MPDSDGWRKDKALNVLAGFYALGMELIQRGAVVRLVVLPEAGGIKVGLDDWLIQEGTFWRDVWAKLERLPLDHKKLKKLATWHHKWKAKQAREVEHGGKSKLPPIYLPAELSALGLQASVALLAANKPPKLFRRGDTVYRIEENLEGLLSMREMGVDRLRHELSLAASWQKVVRAKGGNETDGISPPTDVVRDLLCTPPSFANIEPACDCPNLCSRWHID